MNLFKRCKHDYELIGKTYQEPILDKAMLEYYSGSIYGFNVIKKEAIGKTSFLLKCKHCPKLYSSVLEGKEIV